MFLCVCMKCNFLLRGIRFPFLSGYLLNIWWQIVHFARKQKFYHLIERILSKINVVCRWILKCKIDSCWRYLEPETYMCYAHGQEIHAINFVSFREILRWQNAYEWCRSIWISMNMTDLDHIYHLATTTITVYPKKYAHGFCFAVLCCGYTLTDFPISIRLTSLALWQSNDCPSASKEILMNMDKYFMWIHYERLHNHNKAKHNKTVCIFLGIYCMINNAKYYCMIFSLTKISINWYERIM